MEVQHFIHVDLALLLEQEVYVNVEPIAYAEKLLTIQA
jgi:hypothetical protein